MNNGWIKIYRDLFEHWLWKHNEPFDYRSAWIDLLLLATYADNKELYRGKLIMRKRGEISCSIQWLADRWRWDRRKVKRFLCVLQSDGMLSLNSTTQGTTLTIENYSKWQDECTTDSTAVGTTHGTTNVQRDVQRVYTPKESKESIKKVKECKRNIRNKIPPALEDVKAYIDEQGYNVDPEAFMDYYDSKGWYVGRNKMKDWKAAVRNWNRNQRSNNTGELTTEMLFADYKGGNA